MLLRKAERHSIKQMLLTKSEGGVQIYILCLSVLFMFVVFFAVLVDYKKMSITNDTVDDALVSSLISSCVYNKEEEYMSGSTVLYRTVTPSGLRLPITELLPDFSDPAGNLTTTEEDRDVIHGVEVKNPIGDAYLSGAYSRFFKNLKKNLKLNDSMVCSMSGIDGAVTVADFSIYNQFYNLDENGDKKDFKFIQYTRVGPDVWSVTEYPDNTYPTCYNSLTKSDYTITQTSVAATLSFRVVASRFSDEGGGKVKSNGTFVDVTYTRVVDLIKTE